MEGQACSFVGGMKPVLVMVLVQVAIAAVNIFYKLSVHEGASLRIVVAYRLVLSTVFMTVVAFVLERKKRQKLTGPVVFLGFLCGLFAFLGQSLYLESLRLTSATFASTMTNLIPAMTFVLAISFRLEKFRFGTAAGKAKVFGTLTGISGAMLLTFYKGYRLDFLSTNFNLLKYYSSRRFMAETNHHSGASNLIGAFLALGSCCSFSSWLIVQAKLNAKFPYQYTSTALMNSMASILAILFAACVERDVEHWKLGWSPKLWTILYSGIVVSGIMVSLMSWCVRMRGPLFVSVFNPLTLVLVAISGALFLDEKLHLGSVLGAILIISGVYMVLWGKGQEAKNMSKLVPAEMIESDQVRINVASSSLSGKGTMPAVGKAKEQA